MDSTTSLPLPFYICVGAVFFLLWKGWHVRLEGWGVPLMAVAATAGVWYLIDPVYNDYAVYLRDVGPENLNNAFWEILLFFISLGILAPVVNKKINNDLLGKRSQVFQMIRDRAIETPEFQDQIAALIKIILSAWCLLMVVALFRVHFDFGGLFFPYLVEKVSPWGRDRIGTGVDALYALAGYIQLMLIALLGASFALAIRPSSMAMAGIGYFFAAPAILFDRTRSSMLAILLPGLMALLTLRIRGGVIIRLVVLIVSFMAIQSWMKFVIENRSTASITEALRTGGTKDAEVKAKKHEGFNMYQELGYINYFIVNGTYKVNWGTRYFAEIVNPIPRVLWPGKPLIGIDYALARGMGYGEQGSKSGGVAASISTGMIGQGLVNFGVILGPIASAFLMAIWIALLARQDLMGNDIGHLLLYAMGLVMTYNLGRDITLLVVYPFVFGCILLSWMNRKKVTHTELYEA